MNAETLDDIQAHASPCMKVHDKVNSPSHYTQGGIEAIDAIEAALGPKGFQSYCAGNALKYLWRWQYKGGTDDLCKARWYINRMLGDE
jgi:hypothetical protein